MLRPYKINQIRLFKRIWGLRGILFFFLFRQVLAAISVFSVQSVVMCSEIHNELNELYGVGIVSIPTYQ